MPKNNKSLPILLLLIVGILFFIFMYTRNEKFTRYNTPPYIDSCEFQPACLWDTARWVQLSNGMEGVCTLHGIACPAFSKDHDRARNMGLSPDMVDDRYMRHLHQRKRMKGYYNEGYMEDFGLGMYPTESG